MPRQPASQSPAAGQIRLDLLLKGGTVVDPSQQLHAREDVAVAVGTDRVRLHRVGGPARDALPFSNAVGRCTWPS
ncbi:MAG: hypothetical protein M3O34_03405 [Chloroflexota bacterium]|nr:hypothetical protein [Chloroflexota bacterium]